MTVLYSSNFAPQAGDMPVTHSRIVHAGIWKSGSTSSGGAEGHDASNANHSETYEWWTPDSYFSGKAGWFLSLDEEAVVDCVCIAAHNLGTCGSEVSVTIVQLGLLPVFVEVLSSQSVGDDSPIMAFFPPTLAASVLVEITEPAGSIVPKVGVIRTAKAMQMPRMIYQSASPSRFNRTVDRITNRSASNETLGTHVVRKSLNAEYSWSNIPQDFVYGEWHDFMKAVDVEPAFIAWRPDPLRPYYNDVDYMIEPSASTSGFDGNRLMSVSLSGSVRAWE